MSDTVCQLSKAGMDAFRDYIQASRRGDTVTPPYHLLFQSPYSEPLIQHAEIERNCFYTKYEAVTYLAGVFADLDQREISYNGGLWSWISLYYLEELLETKIQGKTKGINAPDNYILEVEQGDLKWREYSHHLLASPFYLYRCHGDEARMLLAGPIGSRMELTFEIVARLQFARSREFIKLVNRLYSDDHGKMKRGASHKGTSGSIHRLIKIFQQLELTYDIFDMSCEKMIELLPPEFDEWLDSEQEV